MAKVMISFRVEEETKAKVAEYAKGRGLSVTGAFEDLLKRGIEAGTWTAEDTKAFEGEMKKVIEGKPDASKDYEIGVDVSKEGESERPKEDVKSSVVAPIANLALRNPFAQGPELDEGEPGRFDDRSPFRTNDTLEQAQAKLERRRNGLKQNEVMPSVGQVAETVYEPVEQPKKGRARAKGAVKADALEELQGQGMPPALKEKMRTGRVTTPHAWNCPCLICAMKREKKGKK